MKVIAINGSPRKNGNTSILLNYVLSELEKEGIETELLSLSGSHIKGCTACGWCRKNPTSKKCVIDTDIFNEYFSKLIHAQGIILGSPTYVTDITSEMKAFIDRASYVAIGNGHLFKRKLGAAVVAVRRAGAVHAFDTLNHMFLITQMIVSGSSYWNLGIGREIGEVEKDQEGIQTMKDLGQNMAWLLKKVHSEK